MPRKSVTKPESLKDFQLVANLCGVPVDVCRELPTVWPDSRFGVSRSLQEAGYTGNLTEMMKQIEEYREVPKTAPATPVASPFGAGMPQIIVKTGRPEDMSLRELLVALASGERDLDYQNAIRRHTGNRRVFVRHVDSDTLDVDATLELIQYANAGDDIPDSWGEGQVPTETLNEILDQTFYANPITTNRLPRGNEWLKVPEERRILAAYARLAGRLPAGVDEFTIIAELQAKDLSPRWKPIEKAYKLDRRNNPELALRAQAALIWTRKGGRQAGDAASFRTGDGQL